MAILFSASKTSTFQLSWWCDLTSSKG